MMWLIVIIVVAFVFYGNTNRSDSFKSKKSPEELLKERFVKGEIDETTYFKMKETLGK